MTKSGYGRTISSHSYFTGCNEFRHFCSDNYALYIVQNNQTLLYMDSIPPDFILLSNNNQDSYVNGILFPRTHHLTNVFAFHVCVYVFLCAALCYTRKEETLFPSEYLLNVNILFYTHLSLFWFLLYYQIAIAIVDMC